MTRSYLPNIHEETSFLVLDASQETINNEDIFSAHELKEASRFSNLARRQEWLAGRFVVKELMRLRYDRAYCDTVIYSEKDRPVLSDSSFHISLTHKNGFVAAAVSSVRRNGIDLEIFPPSVSSIRAIERACSQEQIGFARSQNFVVADDMLLMLWCLKEASVKAGRVATVFATRNLFFELEPDGELDGWKCFASRALPHDLSFATVLSREKLRLAVVSR